MSPQEAREVDESGGWRRQPSASLSSPCSHDGSATKTTDRSGDQSLSISDFESRIANFVRPGRLSFKYPPTSPTAMYPGSCQPEGTDPWREGPAALRPENSSNANVLLHISFLLKANEVLEFHATPIHAGQLQQCVRDELADLELWRMSEWVRQQRELPDPERLGRKAYSTGEHTCP